MQLRNDVRTKNDHKNDVVDFTNRIYQKSTTHENDKNLFMLNDLENDHKNDVEDIVHKYESKNENVHN